MQMQGDLPDSPIITSALIGTTVNNTTKGTGTMHNQIRTKAPGRNSLGSYRTTARTVGVIYLAGMVIGITGNSLILSVLSAPDRLAALAQNSTLLAIGAVLWLLTVAGDAAHGILMFPVLKQHNERLATGYLAFRIMDATFIAIMGLLILAQIPIGRLSTQAEASEAFHLQGLSAVFMQAHLYAYSIAMLTLGIAGLLVCYALYKTNLLPRGLAVWGLAGYAVILCGSVLELFGLDLLSIHAIPGGLWELFIGVWLIVKGFTPITGPSASPTSSTAPDPMPLPAPN
ncbi:MAG: hypothetical protein JWN05_1780 [Arthrobacter sp.]|jgi:hypothetical protein|nr:hypothetical protein [Arthrobacter sp.]